MFKNVWFLVIALSLQLIFVRCGQRGSPSGGPEDIIPPKVEMSVPLNEATNFNGKRIELKFDEYVTVSGFYNEFIISPPVQEKPKFKVVGKKLILDFDSAFSENTTYNLFFGKAIKDLNKGNVLEQNRFVFSTGQFIDSLSLSGEVFNGQNYKATTKGMVHLYKDISDDSVPSKKIPSYFAQIENGRFLFTNIAAGTYKIFVLDDINGNYLYDLSNEMIAFREKPVEVNGNQDSVGIKLISFVASNDKQFIKEKKHLERGKLCIVFNQKAADLEIEIIGEELKKDWGIFEWNARQDSLILWSSYLAGLDSFSLQLKTADLIDTLTYFTQSKKRWKDIGIHVSSNFEDFTNYHGKEFVLTANCPIELFDFSSAYLLSLNDTFILSGTKGRLPQELVIKNELKASEEYTVVVPPNSLKSIFGEFNTDTLKLKFSTAAPGAFCSMVFKYDFTQVGESGILEFWLDQKKVESYYISELSGMLNLPGFKPGKYKFKFIADKDKNGKWSSGNYYKGKQPEKVYWYKDEVQIRANWEMEVDWVLIP